MCLYFLQKAFQTGNVIQNSHIASFLSVLYLITNMHTSWFGAGAKKIDHI